MNPWQFLEWFLESERFLGNIAYFLWVARERKLWLKAPAVRKSGYWGRTEQQAGPALK